MVVMNLHEQFVKRLHYLDQNVERTNDARARGKLIDNAVWLLLMKKMKETLESLRIKE